MKNLITTLAISLVLTCSSFAQFQADVDGKVDISPVNGNMQYVYPISNTTIDGYPLKVDMIYNSNVTFVAFDKHYNWIDTAGVDMKKDGWSKLVRSMPVWVVGVNGFAVQALYDVAALHSSPTIDSNQFDLWNTFNKPYHLTNYRTEGIPDVEITTDNLNWLIDGYDYCNSLENSDNQCFQDVIRILRSDGSVLELRNALVNNPYQFAYDSLFTGIYYENALNTNAYAIVEFDTTRNWPEYIKRDIFFKNACPDTKVIKPRKMKYYAGDGLEYVFREYVNPYGNREDYYFYDSTLIENTPDEYKYTYPKLPKATIFYLEEINSSMCNLTTFNRKYHKHDNYQVTEIYRGRAPLTEFANHKINYSSNEFNISTFGRLYTFKTDMFRPVATMYPNETPSERYRKDTEFFNLASDFNHQLFSREVYIDTTIEKLKPIEDIGNISESQEHESMYPGYSRTSLGLYLIRQIIDPEGRATDINYISKKSRFELNDFENFSLNTNVNYLREISTALISEIKNPNEMMKFEYWGGNTLISETSMTDGYIDYDVFNSVKEFEIYEYKGLVTPIKLMSKSYDYKEPHSGIFRKVSIISEDFQKDISIIDTIEYKNIKIPPLRINICEEYKAPELDFTYPYKNVTIMGDVKTTTETQFDRIDYIDTSVTSYFYFYPVSEKKTYKNEISEIIILNNTKYEYEFEKVENYSMSNSSLCRRGDFSLSNGYGWLVKKQTQKMYRPDAAIFDETTLLYKSEVNFQHLPIVYKSNISRTATIWNKPESDKDITTEQYTGTQSLNPNEFQYVVQSFTGNVPPIYGIVKSEFVYNAGDTILGGIINNYETNCYLGPTPPPHRRGALLSDTVVGYMGEKRHNKSYYYTGGWYRNFLSGTKNSLGIKRNLYYDYSAIPGYDQYNYPIGTIMKNTEESDYKTFRKLFHQFEAPIAEESIVRKYIPTPGNPQVIVEDTINLRNIYEKGFYGQITGKITPNGWYYKTQYDKNGRITYEWQPYDFPENPLEAHSNDYIEDCIPIISSETYKTITRFTITTGGNLNIIQKTSNYYTDNQNLIVGQKNSSKSVGNLPDSLVGNRAYVLEEKSINLQYLPLESDHLHNGGDVTSLKLSLVIVEMPSDCMPLHVRIPEINFEKVIFLNCPAFDLDSNYCNVEMGVYSPPTVEIDLTPAINFFQSLTPGVPYFVNVSTSAADAGLRIANLHEDFSPCFKVTTNKFRANHQDFTFRHQYNDNDRTVTSYSKIDDAEVDEYDYVNRKFPNTQNHSQYYSTTLTGHDGRYTGTKNYFGAFNFNSMTEFLIGNPESPIRRDTVSSKFTTKEIYEYGQTVEYNVFQTTDQLGFKTNSRFTPKGFIYSILNVDSTEKVFDNVIITPEYYGIPSNEDYYGVCRISSAKNEEGIKITSVYDGLGQLRKTINDDGSGIDNKKITTKYEYDKRGNLIKVINPEGQETGYEYDNFGNMIKSYQPDVGSSKFKYDAIGNLRFKQDSLQIVVKKVSFFEYDDLGRSTIVGEAQFDNPANNYFESLNANQLAVPNGNTYFPTSNPTLFFEENALYNLNKIVPNNNDNGYFNFLETRTSSNLLIHDSNTVDVSDIQPPYIFHKVELYPQNTVVSGLTDFEDISQYPQNVKTAVWYDDFPERVGSIWKYIPKREIWDSISPGKGLHNLKGQKAVIAYKENENDPFNYVTMTYDARGRVEAIMRWNENSGFDMVYYTYNSMNQVLTVSAIDAIRQFMVWNEYDDNGRLSKVFTRKGNDFDSCLFAGGIGFDNFKFPYPLQKPENPDIEYEYNRRNSVSKVSYKKIGQGLEKELIYNPRGWLDSMLVTQLGTPLTRLFEQAFIRNDIGNITKQTSKHHGQNALVQDYTYDALNRLTAWNENKYNKPETYEYDKIGNRKKKFVNSIEQSYFFNTGKNSLNYTFYNEGDEEFSTTYNHNILGQMTARLKSIYNTRTSVNEIISSETYKYNSGGRLVQYEKDNIKALFSSYSTIMPDAAVSSDEWVWGYKYNYAGQREQKRLISSPHGDKEDGVNATKAFVHLWEYYLNGAFGEELVHYKGIVTKKRTIVDNNEVRRVYLAVHRFHATGDLFVLPDGSTEVSISDNIGSVRLVVHSAGDRKQFDYKPFGDTLWTSDGGVNREGFDGTIFDNESSLQMLGARMYDNETGRFTTCDPLWAAFPAQSTYSYAYNSPLTWRDPSGLAPEKEKDREKLQVVMPDYREFALGLWAAMQAAINEILSDPKYDCARPAGGGGGGGGGKRTGGKESSSENGQGGEKSSSENGFFGSIWKAIKGLFGSDDESDEEGDSETDPTSFNIADGKSWSNMNTSQKNNALAQANQYLRQKQNTTGNEWGYTIFEVDNGDGTTSIVAANFTPGNERNVWPNYEYKGEGDANVVGFGHSHPNNSPFSAGDIGFMAGSDHTGEGFLMVVVSPDYNHYINVADYGSLSGSWSRVLQDYGIDGIGRHTDFMLQNRNREWTEVFRMGDNGQCVGCGLHYERFSPRIPRR